MLAAGLAAVLAATFVLRPIGLAHPTSVALTFLLIVLFVATAGVLWTALATSVVALLCFNYFFLPPIGTWHITGPENWAALVALLITSVVASQLSARARARAEEAGARRREAELAHERAELSSALLAAIGHDLRTPLTALRVAVANLSSDDLPAAERAGQAALASAQAAQLSDLFDGILDMARIETRSIRAEPAWSAPADIVEAALAHARPSTSRHAVAVHVDPDTEVNLDPRLTATALAHLIENAARYSPEGSTIEIRAWTSQHGLGVSVSDQGPGLDETELESVFTPLFRGRAGQSTSGTGMGLAIARGLLAAEGGRAWAENRAPHGARFSLSVPAPVRHSAQEADVS